MTTPCNQPQLVTGPFPQTLFMGCSVQDFTLNLGWGSEPSTCTVKIIEDPTYHPSDANYNNFKSELSNRLSQSTINSSSTALDIAQNTIDGQKNLHKNIYKKLQDTENARITNDVNRISDANRKDTGKKIWKFGSTTAIDHTKPDPGFLADKFYNATRDIDIMGSPVHFRFDNVIFNGIVKTWGYSNGSIEVQLQSPTNLIKGTKLILRDYLGTISTTWHNRSAPYASSDVKDENPVSNIYTGNIPNILNVFGHAGISNLGFTEDRGVSLGLVYDYVQNMLSGSATSNRFNPYGAIVGKAARSRKNGAYLTNSTRVDGSTPALTADHYNIIGGVTAADNISRPLFSLDLSDVPRPPDNVYINEDSISLLDFIDRCCEPVGYDFWVELVPTFDVGRSATIKINTISRRYQPGMNAIRDLMQNWDSSNYIIDYKFGQEFQDTKTRSVVVGGKQQRLLQVGNYNMGQYRHQRVFEPVEGSFVPFAFNYNNNQVRIPDMARYRNTGDTVIQQGGAVTLQESNPFYIIDQDPFSAQAYHRGSYFRRDKPTSTTPLVAGSVYSVSELDWIKPYFGRSIDGSYRGVSFNQGLGEMVVSVKVKDFASAFTGGAPSAGGIIGVSETEIRCAMDSMDSWLNYIFEMPTLGKNIDISNIIYTYIRNQKGETFALSFFLNAMGTFSSDKSKMSTLPCHYRMNHAVNLESYYPYSDFLWPMLSELHKFFKDLGDTYYGTQFMIRVPNVNSYVDSNGVRVYDYEITDKAWEEPGNYIDDSIAIGGSIANGLANEDGTFGPIVGYDDRAEYDAYWGGSVNDALDNTRISNRTMAAMFKRRSSTSNWYRPLIHEIDPVDVFYVPWNQNTWTSTYPGATVINPTYPSIASAHGKTPPSDQMYKMYTRATLDEIEPHAKSNTKLTFFQGAPHVVMKVSRVMIKSPSSLLAQICQDYFNTNGLPNGNPLTIAGAKENALGYRMMLAWGYAEKGISVANTNIPAPLGTENSMSLAPRAATPIFAAIPIKSNTFTYGPWSSNPGLGYENDNNLFNDNTPIPQINNLVGEVDYKQDDQAVPWNYGGVNAMDTAILTTLKDSNYYQQVLENGTVTAAGILFLNAQIGGVLINNGPILNSINVQIGNNGFTTTYTMRTYNKKIGFYNKEDAENIQRVNRKFIENRQKNAQEVKEKIREITNQIKSYQTVRAKGKATSPMGVLVGTAFPFLHEDSVLTETDVFDILGFSPIWSYFPYMGNYAISPGSHIVHKQNVVLYDEKEMPEMLVEEYNRKSFMSLDGIFSPISFYPTPYGGTYAQTFYDRQDCPYCNGNGIYSYHQTRPSNINGMNPLEISNARTLITKECKFCIDGTQPEIDKAKGKDQSARPSLIMPPHLVTTDPDNQTSLTDIEEFASAKINKFTLNPIVMQGGEFGLTDVKRPGDSCGHSIDIVAFGEEPPKDGNSMRATTSSDPLSNYASVNQRFMGLRGPVIVHGWGYDTEGFPVPNASGEMELKSDGVWRSITSKLLPDGTWSEPYKMGNFLKGWAQQPASWPVGPIDLRWDAKAGVWTVGANYKDVWVDIEVDLVHKNPARGSIFGESETLPDGARRLVYVKDPGGTSSAPRGASLYCKYDPDSGYYIPLYSKAIITSGTLNSPSSANIYQAYKRDYDETAPEFYRGNFINPLELSVSSKIGAVGLFSYINGSWVLTNIK